MQNHLIEIASHSTGSMLIWDCGEYEVLPYRAGKAESDGEDREGLGPDEAVPVDQSQKLHEAFQTRKMRLRLHGTRLPPTYNTGH